MSRNIVIPLVLAVLFLSLTCGYPSPAAEIVTEKTVATSDKASILHPGTQGEFAGRLIKSLGWDAGLPAEPKQEDYLAILGGKRTFRYEAESVFDAENDPVSLRTFNLYGRFSGSGWLSVGASAATVHFHIFLPLGGEYHLRVASKGNGQRWNMGGKVFDVNTGGALTEIFAGTASLKAGLQEITVELPPEGGVDYFVLSADPLPPAAPLKGWHFNSPLALGELAEVAASLLWLERNLPADPAGSPKAVSVQAAAKLPATVATTTADFLGQFTPPRWVRAGISGASVEVPFDVRETGVYDLKIRFLGEKLVASLDGDGIYRNGKPFLDWVDLGTYRLGQGKHLFKLDIPAYGGVDVLVLGRKKSTQADYLAVMGIKGDPRTIVESKDMDAYLSLIADRYKVRK